MEPLDGPNFTQCRAMEWQIDFWAKDEGADVQTRGPQQLIPDNEMR
jgi:hypothetical protein